MIRYYKKKDVYGVILPRGGGIKFFEDEKSAKQFVLACGLFEDVWPQDEPEAIEEPEPTVAPTPEEETTHTTTEGE